jgi:hypothetical protein
MTSGPAIEVELEDGLNVMQEVGRDIGGSNMGPYK